MYQCILEFNRRGRIPSAMVRDSMRLFAEQVMPRRGRAPAASEMLAMYTPGHALGPERLLWQSHRPHGPPKARGPGRRRGRASQEHLRPTVRPPGLHQATHGHGGPCLGKPHEHCLASTF